MSRAPFNDQRDTARAMHDTAAQLEDSEAILRASAQRSPDAPTRRRLHRLGDAVTREAKSIDRRANDLGSLRTRTRRNADLVRSGDCRWWPASASGRRVALMRTAVGTLMPCARGESERPTDGPHGQTRKACPQNGQSVVQDLAEQVDASLGGGPSSCRRTVPGLLESGPSHGGASWSVQVCVLGGGSLRLRRPGKRARCRCRWSRP